MATEKSWKCKYVAINIKKKGSEYNIMGNEYLHRLTVSFSVKIYLIFDGNWSLKFM